MLRTIVDLVVGLAWPLVILTVGFIYRGDLKRLVPRLNKVGVSGIELSPANDQRRSLEVTAVDPSQITLKPLPGRERTDLIANIERSLHAELRIIEEGQQVDLLVYLLADARAATAHERIYGTIFGSQIEFLKILEAEGNISRVTLNVFFEGVKGRFLEFYESHYDLDKWLYYLEANSLLLVKDDKIEITIAGKDFIAYLRRASLSLDKRY